MHLIYRCDTVDPSRKLTSITVAADTLGPNEVDLWGEKLAYTVLEANSRRTVQIMRDGRPAGKLLSARLQADRWIARAVPIETRGAGGWVKTAPSPGYTALTGKTLADIRNITVEERKLLIDTAIGMGDQPNCAEAAVAEIRNPVDRTLIAATDDRIGNRYSQHGDHTELLVRNGWTRGRMVGENEHWTRPGKSDGTSATWHIRRRVFFNFSSNADLELDADDAMEQGFSLFQLKARLEHQDVDTREGESRMQAACRAAAKALIEEEERAGVRLWPQDGTPILPRGVSAFDDAATLSAPQHEARLVVQRFSETVAETVEWIWTGYIARKCPTVLGSKQGLGKGMVIADLVARLSRGDVMPDGSGGGGEAIRTLIVTREDDAAMVVKPRLEVAAANMANVLWSEGDFNTGDVVKAAENMAKAAPLIEAAVVEHGIGLVVIDPIGAWFEEDSKSDHAVRKIIDPMARVARRTQCGVLFVAHIRKAPADDAMDSFAGSHQMTAAVRVAISMEPINETDRSWRVVKSNFAKPATGMVWRLVNFESDIPTVQWRPEGQADRATMALRATNKAPLIDPVMVLPHLRPRHEGMKDAARRIHRALVGSINGATLAAVSDAMQALVDEGQAFAGTTRRGGRTIGTEPATVEETATDRARTIWEGEPGLTGREVAARAGCSPAQAARVRILSHRSVSQVAVTDETERRSHGTNADCLVPSRAALPLGARTARDETSERPDEERNNPSHSSETGATVPNGASEPSSGAEEAQ